MELTANHLVTALLGESGENPDARAEAVAVMRQAQPSFVATLLSAWQAEGDDLNPALRYDLDAARRRIDFYRSVSARVLAEAPGLTPIKGLEVADLYPAGLVRSMNDLDFVASAETDLWPAVTMLRDDGWTIDTATFSHLDGALQVMVSLRRPNEDVYLLPYGVEVATYYTLGDLGGVGPVRVLPTAWRTPVVKNTLMLLYERFEQPYRTRDLVDTALVHAAADRVELSHLAEAVSRLGLSREYAELATLTNRAGLGPLPVPPMSGWSRPVARARRLARGASFFRRPVIGAARHLQRRLVSGKLGGPEMPAWASISARMPVGRAIRAGLLGFGLPLEGPVPTVDAAVLRARGKTAWVDTPVGRFLLAIGDDVSRSVVDELSGPTAVDSEPAPFATGGRNDPEHITTAVDDGRSVGVAG